MFLLDCFRIVDTEQQTCYVQILDLGTVKENYIKLGQYLKIVHAKVDSEKKRLLIGEKSKILPTPKIKELENADQHLTIETAGKTNVNEIVPFTTIQGSVVSFIVSAHC